MNVMVLTWIALIGREAASMGKSSPIQGHSGADKHRTQRTQDEQGTQCRADRPPHGGEHTRDGEMVSRFLLGHHVTDSCQARVTYDLFRAFA
jgi:hypothetical protein